MKFLIGSESTFLDNIDLQIMLKALPTPITKYNLQQAQLFNLNILQSAIIAYKNEEIVNAFDFFDIKNRDRVSNVRDLIMSQKKNLDSVQDLMMSVKENV
jgi:phosphoenolpyruvate carboxylase